MANLNLKYIEKGKIHITFDGNGMPVMQDDDGVYELVQFVKAVSHGYQYLYNRVRFLESLNASKLNGKEKVS